MTVPTDSEGGSVALRVSEPPLRAEGLTLATWPSCTVFANLLHRLPDIRIPDDLAISPDSTVPILELGAGTGLVGIAASIIWKRPVVLTDLEPVVPALAANIALNSEFLPATSSQSGCGTLDWNKPDRLTFDGPEHLQIASSNKAHIILAADTVYSSEHPALISSVVSQWLSRDPSARFIIVWALRVAYLEEIRELWHLLESAGLEAVEEGKETADESLFDDECLCEWSVWRWKP